MVVGNKAKLSILSAAGILFFAFLLSFLPNTLFFIFLKILFIVTAVGAVSYLFGDERSAKDEPHPAVTIREVAPDSSSDQSLTLFDPRSSPQNVERYFDLFLDTFFPLIKQTIVSNTVVLLLVNVEKKAFFLRYKNSDFEDQFSEETFFDLNQGLPSLVLRHKKELLENHLPASDNLLPYYAPEMPAKSFIGVPVYFEEQAIGVLCADSEVEESFSREDLQILGKYSNILSIQLTSSNKLYEYESENWITRVLYDFSKEMLRLQTAGELWEYLGNSLKSVFNADRITISEKVAEHKGKICALFGHIDSLQAGEEFPDDEGLVGWVLRKNESLIVDDFQTKDNYIPRFYLHESPVTGFRSLLAVPVEKQDQVKAVIALESFKQGNFTQQHKKILQTIAYQITSFLNKIEVIEQLNSLNLVDINTKLGNQKALLAEVDKEIKRATEFDSKFCLLFIRLKMPQHESSKEIFDKIVMEFIALMSSLLRPVNPIFRYSEDTFAIIWPASVSKAVCQRTEEYGQKIAQRKLWAEGMIEKIYLNFGIAQFPEMGGSVDELIENCQATLARAESKGPNTIEVFKNVEEVNTPEE